MWDDPVNMPNILSPDNASLAFLKEVFRPIRNLVKLKLCMCVLVKLTLCMCELTMCMCVKLTFCMCASSSSLELVAALLVNRSGRARLRTGLPRKGRARLETELGNHKDPFFHVSVPLIAVARS